MCGQQFEQDIQANAYIATSNTTKTAATALVDVNSVWDFDGTDLVVEADPSDEGFWEAPDNIVLNGDYEELGSELVTNGGFAVDSDWSGTGSNGYSISSGKLNLSDSAYATNVAQANVTTIGKAYKVTFEISNYVKGSVRIFLGGNVTSSVNSNGTYTFHVVASANTSAGVQALNGGGTTLSLDNLSLKQVDPNDRWSKGTGWTISDGKASNDGSTGNLTQNGILTVDDQYEITVTVSDYVSGSVQVTAGAQFHGSSSILSANGTYTLIQTCSPTTSLFLVSSSFNGKIDNVTVREYAIQPQDV